MNMVLLKLQLAQLMQWSGVCKLQKLPQHEFISVDSRGTVSVSYQFLTHQTHCKLIFTFPISVRYGVHGCKYPEEEYLN